MVDTRFHRSAGEMPISALLRAAGNEPAWTGSLEDRPVGGVSELETAAPGDLCFASGPWLAGPLAATRAGVVILSPELAESAPAGCLVVVAGEPQALFARISGALYPDTSRPVPKALLPRIEPGVRLDDNVSIGSDTDIGAGTAIGANSVIGPGVAIGRNCTIGPDCTIECSYLGNDVVVGRGARLGGVGGGGPLEGETSPPVPQLGRTIVQDGVVIGANTVVDRGALGDTVIGEGTMIGDMVVIGHDCRIGRHCMLDGFTRFAGSVVLEDNTAIAGGAGSPRHAPLLAGGIASAAASVSRSIPPGSQIGGAPAQSGDGDRDELAMLRPNAKGAGK